MSSLTQKVSGGRPLLHPTFAQVASEALYEAARVGPDDESRKPLGRVAQDSVGAFLDGRFRCCLVAVLRFLVNDGGGPRFSQTQVAKKLGQTPQQVGKCLHGAGLVSGGVWTWLVCRMGEELRKFVAPTLERRAIEGYCEAMSIVDRRIRRVGKVESERPRPLDFILLWAVLSSDQFVREKDFDQPKLSAVAAQSLLRLLSEDYGEELAREGLRSAEAVRGRSVRALERWGKDMQWS